MFDGAHVHRLEATHEPIHVNRGGGGAAMITCAKLRSELCATKSTDGANLHFVPNMRS